MTWPGTWSGEPWLGGWDGAAAGGGGPVYLDAALVANGQAYAHTLAARLRLGAALQAIGTSTVVWQVHVIRATGLLGLGAGGADLRARQALDAALVGSGSASAALRAAAWWRAVVRARSPITPAVTLQSHIE